MMMNEPDNIFHLEDNLTLTDNFDFSQSMFDLEEPFHVAPLSDDFFTPSNYIKKIFQGCDNLLKIAHINACSIPKHLHEIAKILIESKIDILCVSETFISPNTPRAAFEIEGFNFYHLDRKVKSRGDVGCYVSSQFSAKQIKLPVDLVQPEIMFVEVKVGMVKVAVGTCYKSPLVPYTVFAGIHENIHFITSKYEHHTILGDFNIDHLKDNSSSLKNFNSYFTEPFALSQVIDKPTRIANTVSGRSSTLIDLILVGNRENVKVHGVIDTPGISDHSLVCMAYTIKKPKFKAKMLTRRDFRNFNEINFSRDMEMAPWGNILAVADDDVDNKVTIFESIYNDIINKHAPFRTFRVTRPASPWLNDNIKKLMDTRDKYKNKFNIDNNPATEEIYKSLRNDVSHAIRQEKIKAFNENINNKIKDSKQFHKALKNFTVVESSFNNHDQCKIDPNVLNSSFVKNNNSLVDDELVNDEINEISKNAIRPSFSFVEVSEHDVIKMVQSIKTNACGIDGISAYFLKLGIQHSVYAFTNILNTSIIYKKFPTRWKYALVKPIPKISNPVCSSDYRPISLLPAFSKVMEKLMCKQIISHLKDTNYFDHLQSAYKKSHSTITALLDVTDNIYDCLDNSELVFLVLLDYSKAFDCANHRLIIAKLKAAGFRNDALEWISSYLKDRQQMVVTDQGKSCWSLVSNGVPQGSVLGPLLFTVLVSDLRGAIKRGRYHMYADDTQAYYSCKPEDANLTVGNINSDLENISMFSKRNCLKLNTDKSKFIVIGSRPNLKKLKDIELDPIRIDGKNIDRVFEARNLGMTMDEELTWIRHVNLLAAKAYGKLKHSYRFKNFLSTSSKLNLMESYILSQLNYGDVILQNLSDQLKYKLQKVQNSCIRFVYGLRKYDHISSFIKEKNILNMQNRRLLHNLTLMHKISRGFAPAYLSDRLIRHSQIHTHFTRNRLNIDPPFARTKMRSMSFFIIIVRKYNEIISTAKLGDLSIATFKRHCKKFLLSTQ